MRRYAATGDKHALHVAVFTLERMAEGGIYDQLGGGFSRYSVDATWTIPHFEKMLYDNGPLLRLYAETWAATGKPLFARVAEETAGWIMREMQSPAGGYYSSLDADSEHEEGKFYVWTPREVQSLLTAEEYAVTAPHYGLDSQANFEGKHWHLAIVQPLEVIAAGLGRSEEECAELLDTARAEALRRARAARAPGLRRQGARELERARDPRHGARGAPCSAATTGSPRHAARSTSSAAPCGRTARSSPPPRTDARTSTPTSTTTRSCSTR